MSITEKIKQKALRLGFDLVGITDAAAVNTEQTELLADWLNCGYAGEMDYMHRNFQKRINPSELMKNAHSIICVGLNYTPKKIKTNSQNSPATGKVANYAQYEDYHPFIKKQLFKLADFIKSLTKENLKFKICVDSAPLAERAIAARAGLGFIGKNHTLINPEFGCQILLGEIITTLELEIDEPIANSCCDCDKCITSCPTGALSADGKFDATKCISYLTIEYKGEIHPNLAAKIGDHIFGCDECIMACPYQKNATVCKNKEFKFHSDRAKLDLQEILDLSEEEFKIRFANSAFERSGLTRLKRNAKICLENFQKKK
ncbi:MAG: tRNA epoxyqueuosine(34) reductase QueG [Planctomycetes bacterium]|nr:tRNA epoxyqueuosine(34) reductase QueG [Planctomycetota bacterium]